MRRASMWAVAMLVAVGAGAKDKDKALSPRFTVVGEGATPEGEGLLHFGPITVRISDCMGSQRARLIGDLTRTQVDPFDLRKDGVPWFRTFLVEVQNGGDGAILFNPSFCFIKVAHDRKFPGGYTDLYSFLEPLLGGDAPTAALATLLDETSTPVRPGETVRRLLVFEHLEPKAKQIELFFDGLMVAGEPTQARLRFERRPLE